MVNYISNNVHFKLNSIKYIYFRGYPNFEALIILLSKAIFFCEILKCKRIFLNKNNFIKKSLFYRKYRMHINIYNHNKYNYLIVDESYIFLYYNQHLNPEIRINTFLYELLLNIPKLNTKPNEIFIYVKSHYSFIFDHIYPPLCFYESILNSDNFTKIKIISKYGNNIIIEKILKKYNNSEFQTNIPFKKEIGYLSNAYNIISSNNYFIYCIYMINCKLRKVYEIELNYLGIPVYDESEFFKLFSEKNISYVSDFSNRFQNLIENGILYFL